MKDMFKEAMKLQAKLLEQLRQVRVEGTAGGGMVRIEMDGEQNVLSVKIEPQVLTGQDVTMLEDLIRAAFNDAHKKVLEKTREQFSSIAGMPMGM